MVTINVIAVFNTLIGALLLLLKKDPPRPNVILGILFLIPSISFFSNILLISGSIFHFPWMMFIVLVIIVFFPPLVLYYILLFTNKSYKPYSSLMYGSIALLIGYTLFITLDYTLLSSNERIKFINDVINCQYTIHLKIYRVLFIVSQLIFFGISHRQVSMYAKEVNASPNQIEVSKVKYLNRVMTLLWLLTLISALLYGFLLQSQVEYIFVPIAVSVIYLFIMYYAIHHNAIFTSSRYDK